MRHLLTTAVVLALLSTTGGAVGAQEASPDPGASPTPEELAAAEERLASATCLGKPATIVAVEGFETVGTPGADVIVGTSGDDIIKGEGGNDRICAGAGNDLVEGGEGKDRVNGGTGDDTLDGGAGNDTINGGKGADMVTGAAGNDRLIGARGDDTLDGGKGNDVCAGGAGHDWLPGCNDKRRTKGKLLIRKNTTLKGPHRGPIVIEASKVTLDCGGYSVRGPGAGIGILLPDETSRITVRNCEVSNFTNGIHLSVSHRNTLTRNYLHHNVGGINVARSVRNKLVSNIADDNGTLANTGYGIQIESSHDNVLKTNSASRNGMADFWLPNGSSRNTLSGNTSVDGHIGFLSQGFGKKNIFRGNRVIGAGSDGLESDTINGILINNIVEGSGGAGFRLIGAGNSVEGNSATRNGGFGFEEVAIPGSNEYVDNICTDNRGGTSSPTGLCTESVPELPSEPDESATPDEASTAEE